MVLSLKYLPFSWARNPQYVYVGRPVKGVNLTGLTPGQNGWLGNPYEVGKVCTRCKAFHGSGGSTLKCYEEYLLERLEDPEFRKKFLELKGKDLVCFCAGKEGLTLEDSPRCHGQVIWKVLESLTQTSS